MSQFKGDSCAFSAAKSVAVSPRRPVEVMVGDDVRAAQANQTVEVSFVMPCLNEARTLEGCIAAAQRCIQANNLNAEIVVADNGSTDGSRELAASLGARVVPVERRGYGAALMGGIESARGEFIVMADADQSYDFDESMALIERLRAGDDLVMGCRMPRGGGTIRPGAMPWKNRWIGNPALSAIGRVLFRVPVTDFHCGLRAFRKSSYERLGVRTTGMEFATEMVVKASVQRQRIAEVPITLHKDGRDRPPHLRPWRDGWRHLRFMLLLAPGWTLIAPGALLMALGLILGGLVSLGPLQAAGITLDVHTLVAASLLMIVGYQAVTVGVAARLYAVREELAGNAHRSNDPPPVFGSAFAWLNFERALAIGAFVALLGIGLIAWVAIAWARAGFGNLEVSHTLRPVIVGATLTAIGGQTVLMSFFYSMLGIRRKGQP